MNNISQKLDDTRTDIISATRARKRKRFFRVLGSKARHAHFRSAPEGQSAVLSEGAKIECKRLERSATFINHPFQTLLQWQTHHVQLGKGPEFYSNNTYAALGSSLRPPNKGEAKRNPQMGRRAAVAENFTAELHGLKDGESQDEHVIHPAMENRSVLAWWGAGYKIPSPVMPQQLIDCCWVLWDVFGLLDKQISQVQGTSSPFNF